MEYWVIYSLNFFLPISKAAIEISATLAIITWMAKRFTKKERQFFPSTGINFPLFAFLLISLVSILISSNRYLSTQGFFKKTLEYFFLFFVVFEVSSQKTVMRKMLLFLFAGAIIVGFDGIYQYFTHHELLRNRPFDYHKGITATFKNPNDLAGYLIAVLPISLSIMLTGKLKDKLLKTLGVVVSILLGVCLVMTSSRGGWLAFVTALIFMGIITREKKKFMWIGVVICILLVALLVRPYSRSIVATLLTFHDAGSLDRKVMWQAAINMIKDKPFFGHGLNTFMSNYTKYWVGGEFMPRYAHNCFLQITAELGIVGLFTFLWLIITFFIKSIRALKRTEDKFYIACITGITSGLFAYLAQSFVDTNFYSLQSAILFWVFLGWVCGLNKSSL